MTIKEWEIIYGSSAITAAKNHAKKTGRDPEDKKIIGVIMRQEYLGKHTDNLLVKGLNDDLFRFKYYRDSE